MRSSYTAARSSGSLAPWAARRFRRPDAIELHRGTIVVLSKPGGGAIPRRDCRELIRSSYTVARSSDSIAPWARRFRTPDAIELHRGTIVVLGNPGGGALFRAEIPEN